MAGQILPTVLLHLESVGSLTRTLLIGYELLGAVLGLAIAYIAYRGYQRNDSRPMLFIAIGFASILGVPTVGIVLDFAGIPIPDLPAQLIVQTAEVAGLLSIIYALRMET